MLMILSDNASNSFKKHNVFLVLQLPSTNRLYDFHYLMPHPFVSASRGDGDKNKQLPIRQQWVHGGAARALSFASKESINIRY